jgi:hypothetical protein
MSQRIIYQPPGLPVAVIIPCNCGLTLEQIGTKDVPQGLPFWIVPTSSIPSDRDMRNAWAIDTSSIGEPSGRGGRK